jgi:hypothetical protein
MARTVGAASEKSLLRQMQSAFSCAPPSHPGEIHDARILPARRKPRRCQPSRTLKEALRELAQIRQLSDELAGAVLDFIETNGRRPIVRDRLTSALAAVLLSHCPPPP